MECILCAKCVGVGRSSLSRVGSGTPSVGVMRFVGTGGTVSSSSAAVEPDLDKVGDGPACLVIVPGSGASHLEGGNSSGSVVLVLVCLRDRCKGVGDATLSVPPRSLIPVSSLSMGESDRGGCGSVSRSGGIAEGLVSGMMKDLRRRRNPMKRSLGLGEGWGSDDGSVSSKYIAGEPSV